MLKLALGDCVIVHDCASRDMFWPEVRPLENTSEKDSSQQGSADSANLVGSSSSCSLGGEKEKLGSCMAFPRAIWWGLEWVRFALKRAWELDAVTASSHSNGNNDVDSGNGDSDSSSRSRSANSNDISTMDGGEVKRKQNKGKGKAAGSQWSLRGYPVDDLFEEKYRALPKSLQKKLKYYRPYVAAANTEVRKYLFESD